MKWRPQRTGDELSVSGRTGWDFASVVVNSWPMLISSVALFVAIPVVVHLLAEPGTEISLFGGFVKYSKSKVLPPEVHPPHYLLPKREALLVNRPVPILDGTIHVRLMRDGMKEILRIGGANVMVLSVGGVDKWGNPITFTANNELKSIIVGGVASRIEIKYQGLFFLVNIEQIDFTQSYVISVSQIAKTSGPLEHVFSR